MILNINIHACAFAAMVGGSLISFRHLNVVVYNYRSSPSLAYWIGNKKEVIKNLHFLSPEVRDKRIEELREEQTSFTLFRAARRFQRRLRMAAAAMS